MKKESVHATVLASSAVCDMWPRQLREEPELPADHVEGLLVREPGDIETKYSDDQPRDEHGRWTDVGGEEAAREALNALPRVHRPGDDRELVENIIPLAPVDVQNAADQGLVDDARAEGMKLREYLAKYGTFEHVNVQLISSMQSVLEVAGLEHFIASPFETGKAPPPTALQYGPHLILRDGNHRVASAMLRGKTTVRIRVVYVSDKR